MESITSVNNPQVKAAANLKNKKFRTETGTFVAEGLRAVREAIAYGRVESLFVTEDEAECLGDWLDKAASQGTRLYRVDGKVMTRLSDTKTPQGVLAVAAMPRTGLADLRPGPEDPEAPVVILDRIQDPGNLGTIIRTADAAGALAVLLLEGCVDAYSPKVVRATMGSLFHLPLVWSRCGAWCSTWPRKKSCPGAPGKATIRLPRASTAPGTCTRRNCRAGTPLFWAMRPTAWRRPCSRRRKNGFLSPWRAGPNP